MLKILAIILREYEDAYRTEQNRTEQNRTEQNRTFGCETRYGSYGLKSRNKLHNSIRKVLSKILKYDVEVDGYNAPFDYPVIFASSHQDNMDMVNSVYVIPEHFIFLNNSAIKPILKAAIELNGCVYVSRGSRNSRKSAKEELIHYLLKGKSINIYPEGAYNLSPNKLHMPYHRGLIDIAQKSGRPIVPFAQEYELDYDKRHNLYIKKVYIKFGKMINVDIADNLADKLTEFDESMSTLTYELYEKITCSKNDGKLFTRNQIAGEYYKDFLRYKTAQIRQAGSTLEKETKALYGNEDEFYRYFPINAVREN